MNDLVTKWVVKYKSHKIGITADKKVYCMRTNQQLIECRNNGTMAFRWRGTPKTIGKKTLKENAVKTQEIIEQYCPF
jgi:hypothetical protein